MVLPMKTPTDPELATFVAALLKAEKADGAYWISYYSRQFLETDKAMFDGYNAPIIRHLIEEEMEKRGWLYSFDKVPNPNIVYVSRFNAKGREAGEAEDKSKNRAVALAAYRTGER